jgi:hypothetical protein
MKIARIYQNLAFSLMIIFLAVFLSSCLPEPPDYPNYKSRQEVIKEAQAISDRLETYIKDWFDGKVAAELPDSLIPKGVNTADYPRFYLQKYEEIDPETQWMKRLAHEIDFNDVPGNFPDPHATYIVLGAFCAPFGTKVLLEGEFPHSRFFDIQATPSFAPELYRYDGWAGTAEVPIVDVDIDPLPNNVNPFRIGVDRNATNRKYRVTFDLAVGNPVKLNPNFKPPHYRIAGNHRIVGAIMYQGPWGTDENYGHHRGAWDVGQLWLRYYAPDKPSGNLGGVPLPKIHYQLPDGRKFFLNADWKPFERRINKSKPAKWTFSEEPVGLEGAKEGWDKLFGIFRNIVSGIVRYTDCCDRDYARKLDLGVTGRGEEQPPPNNYSPSATVCTYIDYLGRGMSIGSGKVAVFTGKLPTFPATRNGEAEIKAAQARYWSLSSYGVELDSDGYVGPVYTSVMDDELILDSKRNYTIVYSRKEDRPSNAKAENGITWIDWGTSSRQGFMLRWLSVYPQWSFALSPNQAHLPWSSNWASKSYQKKSIGYNNHKGFLKNYLPQIYYASKSDFEALGNEIKVDRLPKWK